ncbi:MAG: pyridoxal phosphate-dependent aminotransferase [Bacteroidales bacterium]|nr:pyridoxal phosphate-dependent aminotransferase [Bacteroidales bacterium]
MEKLSNRISSMLPSATVAMNKKSNDLKAQGIDIINLSVGEPDFNTPQHIKDAAKKAIDDNYSFYTDVAGYKDLLQAISEKFKRENNLEYGLDQILVSNGGKHSIANALMALVDKGDEVIIPAPYWVSYYELVKLAEGENVVINANIDNDFKITPEQLEKAITSKTRALILCSPSNPTGSVYSKKEMQGLVNVLLKFPQVFVISDEIYEHINFVDKHVSIAQFEGMKDRVAVINGVSKGFAMTGWRIGYMGAPAWLAKACIKLQGQFTTGASSIAQRASLAALTGGLETVYEMRKVFLRRRDLVVQKMSEISGLKYNIPEGAFYVFPDVSNFFGKSDGTGIIKDTNDMSLYLLEKAHIGTVPGIAFGDPNCIRISYATSDEKLVDAMQRMKDALDKLR